jgi:predicted secreted protein
VSFRDEVWKIDVSSGKTEFIMNLGSESKEDIDAINIKLNKKENFLLFMNKNDMTLWSLQIAP